MGLRSVPGERRFGLRKRSEKRILVERDQQVALANELALLVVHFLDDACNLRLDRNGLEGPASSNGTQFDRKAAPVNLGNRDGDGGGILRSLNRSARRRSLGRPVNSRTARKNQHR